MHLYTDATERMARALADLCLDRLAMQAPLDYTLTPEQLLEAAGQTVTEDGVGQDEAIRLWEHVLAPACLSIDHPRYLSFIPGAPSKAAAAFDMLVGASSVYAGSWLEGSGAVFAENQALRWIADLAGLGRGRWRLRAGRHDRQPLRSGRGARGDAAPARFPPGALVGRPHRRDPFLGQARAGVGHGRRCRPDPR